jgi:FAD/FMN-containing dehydrogenase
VKAGDEPPAVHLIGAMLGGEAETVALLDELVARAGAEPRAASHRYGSYREAKRRLAEIGDEASEADDGHVFIKSEYFRRPLPADAVAALVEHIAQPAGKARELDFTPWGGAYNRISADATAFAHRDELFLLKHGVVVDPAAPGDGRRWLARSWELVHEWGSGGVYPNFPDPDLDRWADAYWGAGRERLLRIKARYDPDGVFSSTR